MHSSPPAEVHALRLPPAACAAPVAAPPIPDGAGLVQAVTDAEKAAQEAFLDWVGQLEDWGRALHDQQAKTAASSNCN
jgi:hypothetical protein